MTKTHLPAHMDSVRQKLRPKHQLLILKCYPRLPKNSTADVRPNGSELSYLLFYAGTRNSKLHKVGAFLEKKTARDVSGQQSVRVHVTLQILTALLENKQVGESTGFALIAPYVLRIVGGVLQNTGDISLIEATQKTWAVFCKDQDQALLAADHEYRGLYEKVVGQYAEFAHKAGAKKLGKSTAPVANHDAIRLRETGLQALRSVIKSNVLAYESGRLSLNLSIPAVLSNVRGNDAAYLDRLLLAIKARDEKKERDEAMNRRQSMATLRTSDNSAEIDPRSAEGSVQDADAIAEESVALLALDALKEVYASDNRSQIRSATTALLNYLSSLQNYRRPQTDEGKSIPSIDSWAVRLFLLCTAWTPVQERFILLVTAVDRLSFLPLKEREVRQHQLHIALIDEILRSDLNLIGLSVMDVLLGLIQHTLRVLQALPQPDTASPIPSSSGEELRPGTSATAAPFSDLSLDSRIQLINALRSCIASLATHIYYTDQVADMVSAILLRLKPNPSSAGQQNPTATAQAIEEPRSAINELASNASPPSRGRSNHTNGFFSFADARKVAMELVRDIFEVANSAQAKEAGGLADARSRLPLSIWEGTQWLLRDPSPDVRIAYMSALETWLELETTKRDFRLDNPKPASRKRANTNHEFARRAASNASATKDRLRRSEAGKKPELQAFFHLFHLANFENALQFAAKSHVELRIQLRMLWQFVKKMGLNAMESGLPMVFALQEEIARIEGPLAKVRIGTLVHGYLWAVIEVFGCQDEIVGKDILAEIARRKGHGLWVRQIPNPPSDPFEEQGLNDDEWDPPEPDFKSRGEELEAMRKEELKAFDRRAELVDSVLDHYQKMTVASPAPPSAPSSPGRKFSIPATTAAPAHGTLERAGNSYLTAKPAPDPQTLSKAREALLATWTRESCLAHVAACAPRSVSLSDSRSSPTHALAAAQAAGAQVRHHGYLQIANEQSGGVLRGMSPRPLSGSQARQHLRTLEAMENERFRDRNAERGPESWEEERSSNAIRAPMRVEELKRVLANGVLGALGGGAGAKGMPAILTGQGGSEGVKEDAISESMVTADEDLEEEGYAAAAPENGDGVVPTTNDEAEAPAKKQDFGMGVGGKGGLTDDISILLEGIQVHERVPGSMGKRFGTGLPPY